ncbi:MAG: nuclear transport factor 2 family protein [Saprospiraceae bacterium]|nr:nuclear transport factor 2 family protein [Saprospiraceae bacterium]
MKNLLFTICFAMAFSAAAMAQPASSSDPLFREILAMDSVLFTAFNNRDLETLRKVFSEDLEFYHDKGGLTNYAQNMEAFKTNFANENWPKRELIREGMEVYSVPGFGAMQIGEHRFCHWENGKMDCGTFKYVHVWQQKDGVWKLVRVVSYGH